MKKIAYFAAALAALPSIASAQDGNPETLAHGGDGLPAQPLYRVRFAARALWGTRAEDEADTVEVEVYEHWLEAAP